MNAGGIGTGFVLFLVLGRVKTSLPPLRSGQALACFVQVLMLGVGHSWGRRWGRRWCSRRSEPGQVVLRQPVVQRGREQLDLDAG